MVAACAVRSPSSDAFGREPGACARLDTSSTRSPSTSTRSAVPPPSQTSRTSALVRAAHGRARLARRLPLPDRLALVALLFPHRQGDLGLDQPVLQVDPQRNQRLLVVIDGLPDLVDLARVEQQLARAP